MSWGEQDEPTWYDTAQICLEGHMINDQAESEPESNKKFCSKCGAATILACPHCKAKIKGYPHIPNVASCSLEEPEKFCDACGHPYPWSESKLRAALDIAGELDGLTDQEREILKKSLPDLLRDVPNTPVAAMRFKKILRKVGEKGGGILWELLKDVASKTATKIILGE